MRPPQQEPITSRMAERVVDHLEAVQVEKQNRHSARSVGPPQGRAQQLEKQGAIGQPGERVALGGVAERMLGPRPLDGDLGDRTRPADRLDLARTGRVDPSPVHGEGAEDLPSSPMSGCDQTERMPCRRARLSKGAVRRSCRTSSITTSTLLCAAEPQAPTPSAAGMCLRRGRIGGQARRGDLAQHAAVGIEHLDRAQSSGHVLLDQCAERGQCLLEGLTTCDACEQLLLGGQRPRRGAARPPPRWPARAGGGRQS